MTRNKQTGSARFPILTAIFLSFLTLKLAGVGTVPLWTGAILIITLITLITLIAFMAFMAWAEKK